MQYELGLHQELVLLSLNDSTGSFGSGTLAYGLAGAIMSELLLLERIVAGADDDKIVEVKSRDKTDDALLDEVLAMINSENKPLGLNNWIVKTAQIKDMQHRVAKQLSEAGILKQDEKKVLWLFTKRIYPELDSSYEDYIRNRMADQMFEESSVLDERTAVLITLAKCVNVLAPNFAAVQLQQHKERIEAICKGDLLAGSETVAMIAAAQTARTAAMIVATVAISAAT